jgi:hypothetical protein
MNSIQNPSALGCAADATAKINAFGADHTGRGDLGWRMGILAK